MHAELPRRRILVKIVLEGAAVEAPGFFEGLGGLGEVGVAVQVLFVGLGLWEVGLAGGLVVELFEGFYEEGIAFGLFVVGLFFGFVFGASVQGAE